MKTGCLSAKKHLLKDMMTAPHQERSLIPQLPREVLQPEDQEAEAEGEREEEVLYEGEEEVAAEAVKQRCQPAHLRRDGMMLIFQT